MNKRHYEHTLPNIRGSLSNTYGFRGCGTLNFIAEDTDVYDSVQNPSF